MFKVYKFVSIIILLQHLQLIAIYFYQIFLPVFFFKKKKQFQVKCKTLPFPFKTTHLGSRTAISYTNTGKTRILGALFVCTSQAATPSPGASCTCATHLLLQQFQPIKRPIGSTSQFISERWTINCTPSNLSSQHPSPGQFCNKLWTAFHGFKRSCCSVFFFRCNRLLPLGKDTCARCNAKQLSGSEHNWEKLILRWSCWTGIGERNGRGRGGGMLLFTSGLHAVWRQKVPLQQERNTVICWVINIYSVVSCSFF